jgi:hypothetical protein
MSILRSSHFFDLDPILVLQTLYSLHNLFELHTTTLKLVFHPLAQISPLFVVSLQFVLHSNLQFADLQFTLQSHPQFANM